jgi:hypothetical protein
MRGLLGLTAIGSLLGCDQVHCVETLATHEKILHGLPGMLVAYAVAWAGLDAARWVLKSPEGRAGRVAGISALGTGTTALSGVLAGAPLWAMGAFIAIASPVAWVIRLVTRGASPGVWRIVGALACTAAASAVLLILSVANPLVVERAGQECAPDATPERPAPELTPKPTKAP